MATQRKDPGRDGGQPRRQRKHRSPPDCVAYRRTGVCVLGTTCLFHHPPELLKNGTLSFDHVHVDIVEQDAVGMDENLEDLSQQEVQDFLRDVLVGFHFTQTSLLGNLDAGPASSATYFSAIDVQRGGCSSLDPSSSSFATYFSAVDVVQRCDCSSLDSSTELESVIEDTKVHWSELRSSNDSDGTGERNCENFDNVADGNGQSNREIFESLRQQPKYRRWLHCVAAPGDISLGPKIAEGGQAEIFEVEDCSRKGGRFRFASSVLKVFKKGYSLQGLKSQWPDGLLFEGQLSVLFQGSIVLEDDRFALLLSRSDMDLRKLIDVTLDKYSPLFDRSGRPRLRELRAYKSKCARSECSTPVFSEYCAQRITYRIALELEYLHSVDILHRDLKASNILCSVVALGTISICVADYESSIGVVGTGFWRAPEILKQLKERKAEIHFTREADVYGFAMTCYEIWTGQIPFEECSPHDYVHVLTGVRPPLPAHVPSWVKDLIQRCWHQNPSERPSFSAIVEELEESFKLSHVFVPFYEKNVVLLERASELVQS